MTEAALRISEIFYSLQGESSTAGYPTVFVRLIGCPLRCQYCDTDYAFYGGEKLRLADIMAQVAVYEPQYVTVTGGEPLAQPDCLLLLENLCDLGYRVSLETSGALALDRVDRRVVKIVDFKTPGSGEVNSNRYENIPLLLPHDEVKFVICERRDYEWAKEKIEQYNLPAKVAEILFLASYGQLEPRELAEWILADRLEVRLQTQLHKQLWQNQRGR